MWYPPPAYSHRRATGTGPGAIIDIGTSDEDGYPPVMIVNVEASEAPVTEELVIDGFSSYMRNTQGATWTDCRNMPDADTIFDAQGAISSTKNIPTETPPDFIFSISRTAMQFDTSILSGRTVLGVQMELFVRQFPLDVQDVVCHIVDAGTITETYPFPVTAYGKVGSTSYGSLHIVNGDVPDGTWVAFDMLDSIIPTLNTGGNTVLCAREAHDLNNVEPAAEPQGIAIHRLFWFQDLGGTCNRLRATVVA